MTNIKKPVDYYDRMSDALERITGDSSHVNDQSPTMDYYDRMADALEEISTMLPSIIKNGYTHKIVNRNGSTNSSGQATYYKNRIMTRFIRFRKNEKIEINNGSFHHAIVIWEGEANAYKHSENVRRFDSSFSSSNETIIFDYNGYICIVFRRPDNGETTPADFDGYVRLYNTFIQGDISKIKDILQPPTTDGTYTLHVTVSEGTPTYSWQSTE